MSSRKKTGRGKSAPTETDNTSTPVDATTKPEGEVTNPETASDAAAEIPTTTTEVATADLPTDTPVTPGPEFTPTNTEEVTKPAETTSPKDGPIVMEYDEVNGIWRSESEMDKLRLNARLAYDSPERLAEYDAETVKLINEMADEVKELEDKFDEAHSEASRRKKAFENAQEDLRKLIADRREQRGKPVQPTLFSNPPPVSAASGEDSPDWNKAPDDWRPANPNSPPQPQPDPSPTAEQPDESWKNVTLQEMVREDNLPPKIAEILEGNGLDTLGKVTEYTNPTASGWCNQLTDFKGFGAKKLEQWQDACTHFWERKANEERQRRDAEKATATRDQDPAGTTGSATAAPASKTDEEIPW